MKRNEIGYCIWVLYHKLWGKVVVDGKLRSQKWWRQRLDNEINQPTIEISAENLWECKPAEPTPIPFEIEMNMPELDYDTLIQAW